MNVYDFDKTIYYPDSLAQFIFFCSRRKPSLYFKFWFPMLGYGIKYLFKKVNYIELADRFNSFIKYIPNVDEMVKKFWKSHEKNLRKWYLAQKRDDDVIISASPIYLLKPLTDKLGVKLFGTDVDPKTGITVGRVKAAREKARHIIQNDIPFIDNFYSDSLRDTPLALCSEHAFLITHKGNKIEHWPHLNEMTKRKIRKKIKID